MVDPLREVLRSPLDDLPGPPVSGVEVLVLVLALMIGIATGWVAGTPDPVIAVSTTTTTTLPSPPADLPPGWTDIGVGYAVSVSWMYTRGEDLLVGVTVANRAGDDPAAAGATALGFDRRGIGLWTVELSGGERVTHTREMFDINALGAVTIEFAGIGATVDDVRSVSVRPAVGYGTRIQEVALSLTDLPARFEGIEPIAATERIESSPRGSDRTDLTFVTIDDLVIDWSNAAVTWSLQDTPDVRVMLQTSISVEGDTDEPVQLATVVGGGAFLQRSFPPISPTAGGVAVLRKTGGATGGSYTPARAAVSLTLSWLRYGEQTIELDLTRATRLTPVE